MAVSAKTVEVNSDTGSIKSASLKQDQIFDDYGQLMEDDAMPFDVNRSDSDYENVTGRASQVSFASNTSDQNY